MLGLFTPLIIVVLQVNYGNRVTGKEKREKGKEIRTKMGLLVRYSHHCGQ